VPINYRPVLISGNLEVSYPSSTTLLVLCMMPTAEMQLSSRIKSAALRRCVSASVYAFVAFMVIAMLVSGVHWLTDIIGGALLSASLVALYSACVTAKEV
jgi:undecaprenyl-diphosphatase